jgi:hypothetical protein
MVAASRAARTSAVVVPVTVWHSSDAGINKKRLSNRCG